LKLDLIAEEYRVRRRWGDRPAHEDYLRRFAQHGPELLETLRHADAELIEEFAGGEDSIPCAQIVPTPQASVSTAGEATAIRSASAMLEMIRRHHLLSAAQLEELGHLPADRDAGDFARDLLERGWLTHYQANQLLQGRGPDLVVGQYVLRDRLGEGGTGEVFKAVHQNMNRPVAVKIIRRELLEDPEVLARFYREMELVGRLAHPNIVHAFDAGPVGSTHVLVMEYVDGVDLGQLVKQSGPLPVQQALAFVRQAALGLQHAHERGLVHRDIKPQNLMVMGGAWCVAPEESVASSPPTARHTPPATRNASPATIRILDFGLARLHRNVKGDVTNVVTPTGAMMMGTPDYLAPEQAVNFHSADIRADVYSLGCTLYYLLTGQPPFPGGSLGEKLARHLHSEPTPIETIRSDLPPRFPQVLRKMLTKRPEDRYQTPAEVAAALAEFPDTPTTISPGKVRGRRPWLAAAAVALVLVGSAWLVLHLSSRPLSPTRPAPPEPAILRDWNALLGKADAASLDPEQRRSELRTFRMRYPGSPEAVQAAELERKLPSSLDSLDRKQIPDVDWLVFLPDQVVAVLGKHSWHHWGPVRTVSFRRDGKVLATAGADPVIRLWDVSSGQVTSTLLGHRDHVQCIDFSSDGQYLVSGARDGNVRFWEIATRKAMASLDGQHPGGVNSVAFAPDGLTAASAGQDGTVKLWRLTDGSIDSTALPVVLKGHAARVTVVLFSPDGAVLASGDMDKTVKLWNVATGKERSTLPRHPGAITALAFQRNADTLISCCMELERGELKIWDLTKGLERVPPKEADGPIATMALSPDGQDVAMPIRGGIQVWNLASGQKTSFFKGSAFHAVQFTPDGQSLALGNEAGQVRIFDLAKKSDRPFEGPAEAVHAVAFSPDGRQVATGEGIRNEAGQVRIWDVMTGKALTTLGGQRGPVHHVAWSPDGQTLASASQLGSQAGTVKLWNQATGKELNLRGHAAPVRAIAFAPDGRTLASADGYFAREPGTIKVWDAISGTELATLKDSESVYALAFSPDGKTLASGGHNQTVKLWDWKTARALDTVKGLGNIVTALAYSSDGRALAIGTAVGRIKLWDVAKKSERHALTPGRLGSICCLRFASSTLIGVDIYGQLIQWDETGGEKVNPLLCGQVRGGDLASDGRHLAIANRSGTIYILRLTK
jgi:WD40 repeat protein/serine/threonine protein kinase